MADKSKQQVVHAVDVSTAIELTEGIGVDSKVQRVLEAHARAKRDMEYAGEVVVAALDLVAARSVELARAEEAEKCLLAFRSSSPESIDEETLDALVETVLPRGVHSEASSPLAVALNAAYAEGAAYLVLDKLDGELVLVDELDGLLGVADRVAPDEKVQGLYDALAAYEDWQGTLRDVCLAADELWGGWRLADLAANREAWLS